MLKFSLLFIFSVGFAWGQIIKKKDTLPTVNINQDKINKDLLSLYSVNDYDPLAPARAAFYSMVIPGLGQIYNRRYWKLPIVYGALATATYFYVKNRRSFYRAREAYRLRQYGMRDEFTNEQGVRRLSDRALIHAQERLKKQMDESMLFMIGIYLLQALEASVDAHLLQVKAQKKWAFRPQVAPDLLTKDWSFSLGVNYRF